MAFEMDWSPDFCLTCDKQISGGAYCSQSCRLADIERASGGSEPSSPTTPSTPSLLGQSASGFYLPPRIDFSAYKTSQSSGPKTSSPPPTAHHSSYFTYPVPRRHSSTSETLSKHSLTPSSSRSSLSSMHSSPGQDSWLSDQVRNELRSYASSFDQVRDWKRRLTLG